MSDTQAQPNAVLSAKRATLVAVLRGFDLETRELELIDHMVARGLIDATVIGHRPRTGYGVRGVTTPITYTHSVGGAIDRLPLGQTLRGRLEARMGRSLSTSGKVPELLASHEVIYCREIFQSESLQAVRVAAKTGARVVVTCSENIPFRYEEDPRLRDVKVEVRSRADRFVAKSEGARRALEIEGVPSDRIEVIPHSVDLDRFTPRAPDDAIRRAWGAPAGAFVLLYAGRLQREKGLVELVLAARDVLASNDDVRLVFQGRGPERPRLESAVEALGLEDRVVFAPWVDASQMPEVYRSADLVLLPSLSTPYWTEQFGFNLIEAMACGRPLLVCGSGAIPEVVGDAARVVPDYDPGALGAAIAELVEDRALLEQMGTAARQRAVEHYSHEVVGNQLHGAFIAARGDWR